MRADRALVWRTMGGKHRRLIGGADQFVEDRASLPPGHPRTARAQRQLDLDALLAEQRRLERRLARFGDKSDAIDIWTALGIENARAIPELATQDFVRRAAGRRESADEAR